MTDSERARHRPIRSYVLREGRLTTGQKRAFDTLWGRFGVEPGEGCLDLPALFRNTHPAYLEIGFGNGESLAAMAQAAPENNYLGVEVHRPGIGHLLIRIGETGLENVRVMRQDAVEVIKHRIADGALAGVFLFFPDPWHKRRHHKRRILQPDLVRELSRVIRPGGLFHAATDWADYGEQMMETLGACDAFVNTAGRGRFAPRPDYRPLTKFERRGQRLGHGVRDLLFRRA